MLRVRIGQLVLALAMLVLVGCQADVDLALTVEPDGSGTVALDVDLDAEAVEVLGDVTSQLRVNDLERAGWTVDIDESPGGALDLLATRPVGDASQWQAVLDQIAGPGVFTDVRIERDDSYANARQEISYDIDVREGWALLSDEGVAEALGGELFGAPIDSLTDGRAIDDVINLNVSTSVLATDDDTPASAVVSPRFDDAEPTAVSLSSTVENSTAVLLRWIAIALFSLFVLATLLAITGIVLQRRSDRLRPTPTPAKLASRVPTGSGTAVVAPAAAATPVREETTVRLVVIDPLTVFYRQPRALAEHVLPFIRENGGTARADTIEEGFRSLTAGSTESDAFWSLCGVEGTSESIDKAFTHERALASDVAGFLAEMQKRRIPVAAVTDDAETWSRGVRDRDRLSAVWPWLVSAGAGVSKSNPAMFEILRRESGVAHAHCLYVDSDIVALDVAKELGMKTALFDTGDLNLPKVVGHPVVTDFTGLIG